jgi:hypothetical protein
MPALSLVCVEPKDSSGLQLTKNVGAKVNPASSIHSLEKNSFIAYFYLQLFYNYFSLNFFILIYSFYIHRYFTLII